MKNWKDHIKDIQEKHSKFEELVTDSFIDHNILYNKTINNDVELIKLLNNINKWIKYRETLDYIINSKFYLDLKYYNEYDILETPLYLNQNGDITTWQYQVSQYTLKFKKEHIIQLFSHLIPFSKSSQNDHKSS